MNKKRIAIIGAGDLGKQIAHFISNDVSFEVAGFFDDFENLNSINGYPVFGKIKDIFSSFKKKKFDELIIGIGYKHIQFKDDLFRKLKTKVPFATIVHPSAWVDPSAKMGKGCVIYPGCIIDQNVKIFSNTLLNLGVIVSHDSEIGESNFLAPGVVVSGFCKTKDRVFIGSNSTIRDNIRIESDIKIGQSSNVLKDLSEKGIYFGNSIRHYDTK